MRYSKDLIAVKIIFLNQRMAQYCNFNQYYNLNYNSHLLNMFDQNQN